MERRVSSIDPGWWDFTTLDEEVLVEAARLMPADIAGLSRPGFQVLFYDSLEEFFLAEAMEYVNAWRRSTADNPVGICGPIGPTEQLPLVARVVNAMGLSLKDAHFWGMDEWQVDGRPIDLGHPLSFMRVDDELCFSRIDRDLAMPSANIRFPVGDLDGFEASFREIRCAVMQGGQGDVMHWAFNDPYRREGAYSRSPPPVEEYRTLGTRTVDLHPLTTLQNARASADGFVTAMPVQATTVGPVQTWLADTVSIWHPGYHASPFGMRLTALMISRRIVDTAVPMSLLAEHPDVRFHFFRGGIGEVGLARQNEH
jgi:glucosamine-6-phosphate deaminase